MVRKRASREANEICIHTMGVGELACGNLRNRAILAHLQLLPKATVATHEEVLAIVEQHKLMGRGVGFVDVHLPASAKLSKESLRTRDKRLAALAAEFGLAAAAGELH
jgi:predicted nucleic acid-binding protein